LFVFFFRTILESPPNIGYSKVRVVFDNERAPNPRYYQAPVTTPYNNFSPLPNGESSSSSFRGSGGHHHHQDDLPLTSLPRHHHLHSNSKTSPTSTISTSADHLPSQQQNGPNGTSQQQQQQQPIVGDVSEPLWIQNPNKEGSSWYEPDELFLLESKRFLSNTDKRIFWEMAKALIELPEISLQCKTGIKNSQELATALKRSEYKVMWTKDAPDLLPKEIAAELLRSAFLGIQGTNNNHQNNTGSNGSNLNHSEK
jgi:hypothetical protein